MTNPGDVSIRDNVGAALRFARENWRFVLTLALIGSAVLTLLAAVQLFVPAIGLLGGVASMFVRAVIYTALIGAVLFGPAAVRGRVWSDAGRVFAAMAIIAFFLFIVTFVLLIPGAFVLAAGPMAPYVEDLQSAGQDEAAVMAVMQRFLMENTLVVLLLVLFYGAVWTLLTSRLYLAAPASVDQKRILTFETWAWTKGAMLRITAARLMLLIPAYVLVFALDYVIGGTIGVNTLDPSSITAFAQANPVLLLAYVFATTFLTTMVYSALEAGLSAYFYRDLKPGVAPDTFD